MKTIVRITLIIILLLKLPTSLFSQDLGKLNNTDRAKKLVDIAKIVYKKNKFKNYYVTDFKTVIKEEKGLADAPPQKENNFYYGGKKGDIYYKVYFVYDKSKILFDENFAACVYIWSKTGSPFGIQLGNGVMIPLKNDGSEDIYDPKLAPKIYTVTYSKDIIKYNKGSLPSQVKSGTVIELKLPFTHVIGHDGWTTDTGFIFDLNSLSGNARVVLNQDQFANNVLNYKIIQIAIFGNTSINATRYVEEYEDPY